MTKMDFFAIFVLIFLVSTSMFICIDGLQCIECSGTSTLDNCYRDPTTQSSYTIRRVTCNPQNNNQGFMGNGMMGLGPLGGNVLPNARNQQQTPGISDPNGSLGNHGTIYDNAVGNQGNLNGNNLLDAILGNDPMPGMNLDNRNNPNRGFNNNNNNNNNNFGWNQRRGGIPFCQVIVNRNRMTGALINISRGCSYSPPASSECEQRYYQSTSTTTCSRSVCMQDFCNGATATLQQHQFIAAMLFPALLYLMQRNLLRT